MDAVKFIKEKQRMEESINYDCFKCELCDRNNGTTHGCKEFQLRFPEKAVAIIEKWSQEHPRKTFLSDFLEKHPKAPLDIDFGTPQCCPNTLGYTNNKKCLIKCIDCWNRPLEE